MTGQVSHFVFFISRLLLKLQKWGCADKKLLKKVIILQKKCIRNIALRNSVSHTEPVFKDLKILKFTDKLTYFRFIFVHQYKNNKLPTSFSNIFQDITSTDVLQTRHNDYNYNKYDSRTGVAKLCLERKNWLS